MLDSLNQRRDLCDGISLHPRRPALPPTSDQWYLGFNVLYIFNNFFSYYKLKILD